DLNAALQHGTVFHADAGSDDVADKRALAADVKAVTAINISIDLAHDDDFARGDVGRNRAVSTDGDAVIFHDDRAFDPSVNIEGFGTTDFALNHQRAADRGLLHGSANRFHGHHAVIGRREL